MKIKLDGNDWQLIPLIPFEWVYHKVWNPDWNPLSLPLPAGQWIRGTVPGDVISDALDAKLVQHPYQDLNSRTCEWLSERDWVYRKQFTVPPDWKNKIIRLQFDGVDYACSVYLNGDLLGEHEGMFTPFEFQISHLLHTDKINTLVVIVKHAPHVEMVQGQVGWTKEVKIWKSRFAYNWDWCTRLVPVGIWQSIRLIVTDSVWIKDIWIRPKVHLNPLQATLEIHVYLKSKNREPQNWKIQVNLHSPSGDKITQLEFQKTDWEEKTGFWESEHDFEINIKDPQLWYPNGMGQQPLYQVQVDILDLDEKINDTRTVNCGLRSLRAIPNEGASLAALPYTLEINGQKIFAKGWNWVPIDLMYGRIWKERYERLLTLAKHAHCNLLRVWGGGLLERKEFYDLCDKFGILVWQEFIQSSSGLNNSPSEDKSYLDYIENQARQMVPLRRNHPSLVIWCGGNELMDNNLIPLNDDALAIKTLKSVVNELDPDKVWLPTSASGPVECPTIELAGTGKMHDVHGTWWYLGPEEHYKLYNAIDPLFHSEFGTEGAINLYTLQKFISPEYHFPPDQTNPIWVHHGYWWIHREKLEKLFGPFTEIESFIKASQWIHAEGLRYLIESNRRRKWKCSGVCPWQLNEPFPNTTCSNAVDYLGLPKPAYWYVRRAYEPVHLSLKYDKLTWKPGETWQSELWLNCGIGKSDNGIWKATLMNLKGKVIAKFDGKTSLSENTSLKLAEFKQMLPSEPDIYILILSLENISGEILSRNEYLFTTSTLPFDQMLKAPKTQLTVSQDKSQIVIENKSEIPALFVQLFPNEGQWILPSDDYFCLTSSEKKEIKINGNGKINVQGWNTPPYTLEI